MMIDQILSGKEVKDLIRDISVYIESVYHILAYTPKIIIGENLAKKLRSFLIQDGMISPLPNENETKMYGMIIYTIKINNAFVFISRNRNLVNEVNEVLNQKLKKLREERMKEMFECTKGES